MVRSLEGIWTLWGESNPHWAIWGIETLLLLNVKNICHIDWWGCLILFNMGLRGIGGGV